MERVFEFCQYTAGYDADSIRQVISELTEKALSKLGKGTATFLDLHPTQSLEMSENEL